MGVEVFSWAESVYKSGLYPSFTELYPLIYLSPSLSPAESSNLAFYQAASLQRLKEFKRAEVEYQNLLQERKNQTKTRTKEPEGLVFNEVELKYRLHECYVGMGQTNQAVNVLQNIPTKLRNRKIYAALGSLYHQSGIEVHAIASYREVIKECPLALEAIKSLLQMGVSSKEIQDTVQESHQLPAELSWFPSYINSMAALYAKDYKTCVKECIQLEDRPELRDSVNVLVTQGLAHYWAGDDEQARMVLHRASSLDNMLLTGMDTLAAILNKLNRPRELDTLATRLMGISEERAEAWIALGHYCHLNKNYKRAVYFAHKACLIDTRNVEALLLKGNMFLDLKKYRDAMNHFREAAAIAPSRYETHRGMVECNIGLQRQREAITVATGACRHLNNSPRALTLFASVLLKEPLSVARAKTLLERAAGSGHLPAIYLLVDLLDREGAQDKAVELLQKTLVHQNTCRLQQLLADLLAKQGQEEAAMEHYSLALSLDPKNEGALNGLHKMEAASEGGLEASYDQEMAEIGSSHGSLGRGSPVLPGHDLEDSETEAVWSDGDLNIMGGS